MSTLTAAQFAAHAVGYQAIVAQADAIHEMLVNTLGGSAASYVVASGANVATAG